MTAFRSVCWTLNNYLQSDVTSIKQRLSVGIIPAAVRCKYICFQEEVAPTTGTPHLQGYAEFKQPVTMHMLKQLLGDTVHIEKKSRNSTRKQARDYCFKEDSRKPGTEPWENVPFPEISGEQGRRTDLAAAIATLKEGGIRAVAEEHPEVFVRSHRGLMALASFQEDQPRDEHFAPRPWQAAVVGAVSTEPNDRSIFWVTDAIGGKGKSRLARHILAEHAGLELSGRVCDMAHILGRYIDTHGQPPRVVVIDISRAAAENTKHLYSFAEMLKNGRVIATKYDSRQLAFKPPHVLFFSNSSWDRTLFSHDRVKEWNLACPDEWPLIGGEGLVEDGDVEIVEQEVIDLTQDAPASAFW